MSVGLFLNTRDRSEREKEGVGGLKEDRGRAEIRRHARLNMRMNSVSKYHKIFTFQVIIETESISSINILSTISYVYYVKLILYHISFS